MRDDPGPTGRQTHTGYCAQLRTQHCGIVSIKFKYLSIHISKDLTCYSSPVQNGKALPLETAEGILGRNESFDARKARPV